MKRGIVFIVFCVWICSGIVFGVAGQTTISVNGSPIVFSEQTGIPFVDASGRTLVPLRECLNAIDCTVGWNGQTKTVESAKGDVSVNVTIGEKQIVRNGSSVAIDTAAIIKDGRTYIPLRAVMEAYGYTVGWNAEEGAVTVSGGDVSPIGSAATDVREDAASSSAQEKTVNPDSKYDPRLKDMVTPVRDQGSTDSCWAFSLMGSLESALIKEKAYDFSEDNMINNNPVYTNYGSGGNEYNVMAYLAGWRGPLYEKDDPFNDGQVNKSAKAVKHIQGIEYVDTNKDAIKTAVKKYGSVMLSMHYSEDDKYFSEEKGAYYFNGDEKVNHSLLIVGWDDSYSKDNFGMVKPSSDGAYIVKNSWGTTWGEKGYGYISYENKGMDTESLVITRVEPVNNYARMYQHDNAGVTSWFGNGDISAWYGNVFTKETEAESLKAVSFYTSAKNTQYSVYYVDGFDTVKSFANKKFVTGGTVGSAGYHTIDFAAIPLSSNEKKFAVMVNVINEDMEYPIPAEIPVDQFAVAESTYLQSFVSGNGEYWQDFAMQAKDGNVCIKAFTN